MSDPILSSIPSEDREALAALARIDEAIGGGADVADLCGIYQKIRPRW